MDQFLINLALCADPTRLTPFPDSYRITSKPGKNHTMDEYNCLINDIKAKVPKAISLITNIDLGIAKHDNSSALMKMDEYEFKYPYSEEYLKNMRYPKRWYLFHGSPISNWHSILRTGIKNMSGTRFMTSGQAYGSGVYLSDNLMLSLLYGSSRNNTSAQSVKYCISVIELLVDPVIYNKGNNVYVVPDESVLFPRYLYYISQNIKTNGVDLLKYYTKLRNNLLVDNRKDKRIEFEITELLTNGFLLSSRKDYLILKINKKMYKCYLYKFPICPPVIVDMNEKVYEYDYDSFKSILILCLEISENTN